MSTTTTELLTQAQEALARVEHERAQAVEAHRAELAEYGEEMRTLRGAIRVLEGKKQTRPAAVQAGPAAMGKVRDALARGALSQAEITKQTRLNDGTVSYALRALVANGEVETTGVRISGSREFRLRAESQVA